MKVARLLADRVKMKKTFVVWVCFLYVSFLMAEYKPNGPPLHVCVGAVPMEPNTDKLEQNYFVHTKWAEDHPYYVLATTKEEFNKGLRFLNKEDAEACEFKEKHLHIFFYNGKVEERQVDGLLGALIDVQVFGIERVFIKKKSDVVTVHVTCMDIGKERPMREHTPAIFYSIPFDKLDTEEDGTPDVTDKTQFVMHHMSIVNYNPKGKMSKGD